MPESALKVCVGGGQIHKTMTGKVAKKMLSGTHSVFWRILAGTLDMLTTMNWTEGHYLR